MATKDLIKAYDDAASASIGAGEFAWTSVEGSESLTFESATAGTTVHDTIYWTRSGSWMDMMIQFTQTAAGTGGSGDLRIQVPNSYTIDSSRTNVGTDNPSAKISMGNGVYSDSVDLSQTDPCAFYCYDTTFIGVLVLHKGFASGATVLQQSEVGNANLIIAGHCRIPILEWAAS